MFLIPLAATPSQVVYTIVAGQNCTLAIYQKSTGMYFDLTVNNDLKVSCVVMLNRVLLVREAYLGFIGDFAIVDLQGDTDPDYASLGTRYVLVYLAPDEVPAHA